MHAPCSLSGLPLQRTLPARAGTRPRGRALGGLVLGVTLGLALGACGQVVPVNADGGPGADGGGGPAPGAQLPLSASFEMIADVTFDGSFPGQDLVLDEHRFILRLDDLDAASTAAIAGTSNQVESASFARQDDDARTLSSALALTVDLLEGTSCELGDMRYEQMRLVPVDDDGDGAVDRLQGTAAGTLALDGSFPDAGLSFTAEVTGTLDTTPPRLALPGSEETHHVLAPIRVLASEPLPAGTRLTLRSDADGPAPELAGDTNVPGVISLSTGKGLLPFGSNWTIDSEVPVQDLAGNQSPGELPRTVQVMADPGLFAVDGFEGPLQADVRGPAEVVSSVGEVLAISGQQSLRMEPGSRVTLVLSRPSSATRFFFQMRTLHRTMADTNLSVVIEIGAPGSTSVTEVALGSAVQPVAETGDPVWQYAGDIRTTDGLLPDAGGELVVLSIRVDGPQMACMDGVPSQLGLLIDDLVLE